MGMVFPHSGGSDAKEAGGMQGIQDIPKLYHALRLRGYGDDLLQDIFWNNLRRLL